MYFSNIGIDELEHFHDSVGVDFSISLTEIIDSDLFHVEDMGNSIYKVCPLFYCNNVISSNLKDKVDNHRCLILSKQSAHETYLSFQTYRNDSILINEDILNIKKINENLTTDEFNALVYLLRQHGVISSNLNFDENNYIQGKYGNYIFGNLANKLQNDKGIIINDDIKTNPITVKLTNPYFINANYILTFTVISITGANVCEVNTGNFIHKDTFTIKLIENTEIPLDLSEYTNDSVLLFDVGINVDFNVPEIVNRNFGLSLNVSSQRIGIGEELLLTATLSGEEGIDDYVVNFFEDANLIGSDTTDINGVATLNYTPTVSGIHNYSCNVIGLSRTVNVTVINRNTILDLSVDNNNIKVYADYILTGVLTDLDGNRLANKSVNLYENDSLLEVMTTDNNGEFNKTISQSHGDIYRYRAEYTGSEGYYSASSSVVNVNVNKYSTAVTLNASVSTMFYEPNCSFDISGVLTKEGQPFDWSKIVYIYNNNSRLDWLITNHEDGSFQKTISPSGVETYNLQAKFEDGTYDTENANSPIRTVVVRKKNSLIFPRVNKTTVKPNESVVFSGGLVNELGEALTNRRVVISGTDIGYTTDSNGLFAINTKYFSQSIGSKTVTLSYAGDTTHNPVTSESFTINCVKFGSSVNILNNQEYYIVGDTICIQVSSDDANFNPSSIDVVFNGNTYNVTSKNQAGEFIFTIPEISSNNTFNLTARYNGDSTHENSSETETIPIYKKINSLTLSNNGNTLIVTVKNRRGEVVSNITLSLLDVILSGFNVGSFQVENVPVDSTGKAEINLTSVIHGSGTIKVKYENIESNTINITL